jgi:hypothetical protein
MIAVAGGVCRTNTAATVFPRVTTGCAECHEQKYDPFGDALRPIDHNRRWTTTIGMSWNATDTNSRN